MITLPEARELIDKSIKTSLPAKVSLTEAIGRVVAEDVTSPINVPEFPNSSMDGIAFRFTDLDDNGPWRLPIQAVVAAGDNAPVTLKDGHACKIMTGAPLMGGADTVLPIEDVTVESNEAVFEKQPTPGRFIRPMGNDITVGQVLFHKGDRLKPHDVGVFASVGMTEVKVIPRPRIALISTGPEVIEPGEKLGYGQIYDSNTTALYSLLTHDRYPVAARERIRSNNYETFRRIFTECLNNHDLVISTGAVSMGDFDCIPEITKELGSEILFHKVAIKPGKPTLIAAFKGKWLISLPGNPVSAVVGYHLYVKRIISHLCGIKFNPRTFQAILGDDLKVTGDRFYIVGSKVEFGKDNPIAHPSTRQDSGRLSSISGIDSLIMVDGGTRTIPKGSPVFVEMIDP